MRAPPGHSSQTKILNSELPSSQEGTKSCNPGTGEEHRSTQQSFPGKRSLVFALQQHRREWQTVHICLKTQYFVKAWDLQFWSFLPCNSYSRMTQVPINNQTTVQQPGSLSNYKIMVPSSSSASSPEEWGKGREHRERKSANRMIMSFLSPTATESCN